MTFPVSNPQVPKWAEILYNAAIEVQSYCLQIQAETASGGAANCPDVLNIATAALTLQGYIARVSAAPAAFVTALVSYFNSQVGWASINVANEFGTVNTLAGNLINAITGAAAEYPHDAANPPHLLDRVWVNNQIVNVTLTAAQMPNTMAAIAAYLNEVPVTPAITV